MFRLPVRKPLSVRRTCWLIIALLLVAGLLHFRTVYGDQLPIRSLQLGQARPGLTDTYTLGFTIPNSETLGSIELRICEDGPLLGTPCTVPGGFDMTNATLGSQQGITDFAITSATTNVVVLSRTASSVVAGSVSYELMNITNPSIAGSYYGRVQTFATEDATGNNTDYGGLAFAINDKLDVSAVVPPFLYFCLGVSITGVDCTTATGDYINFGDFSAATASVAQTQMVSASNADSGYTIAVSGNTLTSGNNIIPAIATPDVSRPGTSQFGINLVANADPPVGQNPASPGLASPTGPYGQPNKYAFVSGDVIAGVSFADDIRKFTTSYIANIAKSQAAGIYVSTITYIATAGF